MKKFIIFMFSVALLGSCQKYIKGCTDATAVNYNPEANTENSSCLYVPALRTKPFVYDSISTVATGGIITSDGGSEITVRGICWGTSSNPTVANDTTINGTGTGTFNSTISNLQYTSTYYVRAYATNSNGTGYGDEYHFTPADITFIPDQNFEQVLIALGCDDIIDGKVETHSIDTLSNLDLGSNFFITDLTGLEDFTSLYYINCYGCSNLTSINLTQNHFLNYLDFCETQISSIDLTQNTALTILRCHNNPQLYSLDLSKNTQLNSLECSGTSISSLDLTMNSNLTNCYCSGSQLSCVNLRNGNNQNISGLVFTNNSNLSCIEVDNPTWSTQNWIGPSWIFGFDSGTTFSTNCNYPSGCF